MKKLFNKAARSARSITAVTLTALFAVLSFQTPMADASIARAETVPDYFNVVARAANRPPVLATSTNAERNNMIIIRFGHGGEMNHVLDRYRRWINEGRYIVVDGRIISADAFGAFNERYQGRVCYTDRAVFSPHAARYENGTDPLPAITDQLARTLVPALEREFRASPYYNTWRGSAYINADRLREIYPQGECSDVVQRIARNARQII